MISGAEIHAIHTLFTVLVAEYQYLLTLAIDSQIPRLTQCVQYSDIVLVNVIPSGIVHFSQDRDGQIHELHRDHGIFNQIV